MANGMQLGFFNQGEILLVVNVKQFLGRPLIEKHPVAVNKLERIPGNRVVTGGDTDATTNVEGLGQVQQGRGGHDPGQYGFAADAFQPRGHRVLQHLAGRAGVAANHHGTAADEYAEGLGKACGYLGRKRFADDASNAGDADFERGFYHGERCPMYIRDPGCGERIRFSLWPGPWWLPRK